MNSTLFTIIPTLQTSQHISNGSTSPGSAVILNPSIVTVIAVVGIVIIVSCVLLLLYFCIPIQSRHQKDSNYRSRPIVDTELGLRVADDDLGDSANTVRIYSRENDYDLSSSANSVIISSSNLDMDSNYTQTRLTTEYIFNWVASNVNVPDAESLAILFSQNNTQDNSTMIETAKVNMAESGIREVSYDSNLSNMMFQELIVTAKSGYSDTYDKMLYEGVCVNNTNEKCVDETVNYAPKENEDDNIGVRHISPPSIYSSRLSYTDFLEHSPTIEWTSAKTSTNPSKLN